jgi:PEGA domain-containing protein
MFLKRTLLIALFLAAALPSALTQDQGRRIELEESLQSRYRLTILGGGFMGIHGDNSIRRAGGVVTLVRDGLYGSYDRGRLASNAIRNGQADLLSADKDKDVVLERGERFYVTAIYVGSDVVTMGLLSVRMIPSSTRTSQVWGSVNFFFDKDTLAQGDIAKIYPVIDQWLLPEGATSAGPPSVPPAHSTPVAAAPPSNPVDLKPGMTRGDIVNALGAPLQEAGFGDHRWLTYPGITITLEQGKLISVDRNAQVLVPVRISSDPGGADVFLDGSFVSSTPAVLRLQAGTYKIAVKMSGYADWEREIKILPGAEVNLNARLSK